MNSNASDVQKIFNEQGQPLGAILGPKAWAMVRDEILKTFGGQPGPRALPAEPLEDWRILVQSWDFKYPVDLDVACPVCGNTTENWELDEPRKFWLTAANFGGLVTFHCLGCQAKIMKRHFKDVIKVEARPYTPERVNRNLGRP